MLTDEQVAEIRTQTLTRLSCHNAATGRKNRYLESVMSLLADRDELIEHYEGVLDAIKQISIADRAAGKEAK